ncbi:MAG: tetratricopeptide repeat protein, partial [Candidatus Acidiferrales bacterium]
LPTKPPPPPPAQPPAQSNGQAAPPAAGESSSRNTPDGLGSSPPPPPSKSAGLPGDAEPLAPFNPLEAEKDVEVGQFYLKQGKYDAAIDRFKDAAKAVPTYALPWQLMGQAYEKKGDVANSIAAFQKYLKLYPHAPERKKIEDHIDELQKKLEQKGQKSGKK